MVRRLGNSKKIPVNIENTKLSKGEIFLEVIRIISSLVGKVFPWGALYFIAKELAGKSTTLDSNFLGEYANLDFENLFKNLYVYVIIFFVIVIFALIVYISVLKKENKNLNEENQNLKQIIKEKQKKGVKKWI